MLLEGSIQNKTDKITSIEFGLDTKYLYVGTDKSAIYKFELPSPKEVKEEYEMGPNNEAPRCRPIGEPFDAEDVKEYNYAVKILHRVSGFLEEDFFILHLARRGIKVWSE